MNDTECEEIIIAMRENIAVLQQVTAASVSRCEVLEAENAALREALAKENFRVLALREALKWPLVEGVNLMRKDATSAEWKRSYSEFMRNARATLARQTEGEG